MLKLSVKVSYSGFETERVLELVQLGRKPYSRSYVVFSIYDVHPKCLKSESETPVGIFKMARRSHSRSRQMSGRLLLLSFSFYGAA